MSKDTIYRQDAIEVVRNMLGIVSPISDDVLLIDKAQVQTELMMLPSAESNIVTVTINIDEKRLNEIVEEAERRLAAEAEDAEPRKGKWLDDCGGVKCSVCGYTIDDPYYVEDYCTKCGSFNGEEEE